MVDFVVCNSTSLTDRLCCTVYGTVVSSSNSASMDESHPPDKFNLWEYNIPDSPANDSCSIPRPVVWYLCANRRPSSISCGIRFVDKRAAFPLSCTIHLTHPHHFLNNSTEKTGIGNLS